jgi:hypothetical protein
MAGSKDECWEADIAVYCDGFGVVVLGGAEDLRGSLRDYVYCMLTQLVYHPFYATSRKLFVYPGEEGYPIFSAERMQISISTTLG